MTAEQRTFVILLSDGGEYRVAAIDVVDALRKAFGEWVVRDRPCPTTILDGPVSYQVDLLNTRYRPAEDGDWTRFADFDVINLDEGCWTQGDRTYVSAKAGNQELFDRETFVRFVEDELGSGYYHNEIGKVEEGYMRRATPEDRDEFCEEACEFYDENRPCALNCFFICGSDDPGAIPVWVIPYRCTREVNQ